MLEGSEYASPENPARDIPVVRGDGSVFGKKKKPKALKPGAESVAAQGRGAVRK